MNRHISVLLCAGLMGCAGSGARSVDPLELPERFMVSYRGDIDMNRDTIASSLRGSIEALPGVFELVGLPIVPAGNTEVPTFITPQLEITGELFEGEDNADYLRCGTFNLSGDRSDSYVIRFSVIVQLLPVEGVGTEVSILIDGEAWDRFLQIPSQGCVGTGKLERDIQATLRRMAAGS